MKRIFLIYLTILLSGCYGVHDYPTAYRDVDAELKVRLVRQLGDTAFVYQLVDNNNNYVYFDTIPFKCVEKLQTTIFKPPLWK